MLLLDTVSLSAYKRGDSYRYADGGFFDRSPAVVHVPHSGHWHVVVDLGGGGGRVDGAVQVLSAR